MIVNIHGLVLPNNDEYSIIHRLVQPIVVTGLTTDALMKPSTELIMKYTIPTTATFDAVGPSRGLNR